MTNSRAEIARLADWCNDNDLVDESRSPVDVVTAALERYVDALLDKPSTPQAAPLGAGPERYVTGAELERVHDAAEVLRDAASSYAEAVSTSGRWLAAADKRLLSAARAWVALLPAAPSAPQGPSMAVLRELAAEFYSAGDEWAGVRLETVAGLVSPPVEPRSAPQAETPRTIDPSTGHYGDPVVMECAGEQGCGQAAHHVCFMCSVCEAHRYPNTPPRSHWMASAPQGEAAGPKPTNTQGEES